MDDCGKSIKIQHLHTLLADALLFTPFNQLTKEMLDGFALILATMDSVDLNDSSSLFMAARKRLVTLGFDVTPRL